MPPDRIIIGRTVMITRRANCAMVRAAVASRIPMAAAANTKRKVPARNSAIDPAIGTSSMARTTIRSDAVKAAKTIMTLARTFEIAIANEGRPGENDGEVRQPVEQGRDRFEPCGIAIRIEGPALHKIDTAAGLRSRIAEELPRFAGQDRANVVRPHRSLHDVRRIDVQLHRDRLTGAEFRAHVAWQHDDERI